MTILQDFVANNRHIIRHVKGMDRTYDFHLKNDDGSVFNWNVYSYTAEGRYSTIQDEPDMTFFVTPTQLIDGMGSEYKVARMNLWAIYLPTSIRESLVYIKLIGTNSNTGEKRILALGEIRFVD